MKGKHLTDHEMKTAHDRCAHINFWGGTTLVDGEEIQPFEPRDPPPPECESFAHHIDAAVESGHISDQRARAVVNVYKDVSNRMPPETLIVHVNLTVDPAGTVSATPVEEG